ncbi:MAG: aryl-sulfate sulfotransferase [Ignavibacteria bacterium]|nr:aryl-sulfate sulfotransferase [Ignavibacteria bacterium]
MKLIKQLSVLFTIVLLSTNIEAQEEPTYQYLSPLPGSKLLSRETNIIFIHKNYIDHSTLIKDNLIKVIGSQSGIHYGEFILSDDRKTMLFNPDDLFTPGETVTVTLNSGIKTISGKLIDPVSYSFSITPLQEPIRMDPVERLDMGITMEDLYLSRNSTNTSVLDTIPTDFPEITIDTVDNPAPGNIFISNVRFGGTNTDGFFLMILDNAGNPIKYKRMAPIAGFDFKVQQNGLLSYSEVFQFLQGYSYGQFKIMDTSLTVIDSVQAGNGYQADLHEFLIMPNGHYLLMIYDPQPFDMSEIVPGGDPNAIVIGGIIQELDADKNVVFQWRSWDYIPVTDTYADLLASQIDYMHLNAVDLDEDGNLLFIGRHLSEVTKISRQTGEIIWRLGGKQNEFKFINEHYENEPTYFAEPHDIRRIDNGNITLFDNGDFHNPPYSRGVEYKLDEVNKTATLEWEYRHTPDDVYAFAMGSVQRLSNGNTLIGWGTVSAFGGPVLTEIHPDGSTAFEMFFPPELASYRAFRFPWASGLPVASVTINDGILEGNIITFNIPNNSTGVKIKFNFLQFSTAYPAVIVKRDEYSPENPEFDTRTLGIYPAKAEINAFGIDSLNVDIYFQLDHYPQVTDPQNTMIYHRLTPGTGIFTPLTTTYNGGTNELMVSSVGHLGEFIFTYPDVNVIPTAPQLVSPKDNQIVNQDLLLAFEWSPQGFANKFWLQVSTEANFNSTEVDDSSLTDPYDTLAALLSDQQYYWRVRSKNSAGWGDWSEVWSFNSAASFLSLTFPNGGEVWQTDSSLTIKWDHNLLDSVKIDLYKNDTFYSVVIDTLFSVTGGYKWTLQDSIPSGTDYKILVTSLQNGSLADMSDNNFSVVYIPVSVEQIEEIATDYRLEQNYPNPFNPSTTIRYSIPIQSKVNLTIYNSIGENIAEVIDLTQNAGSFEVKWSSNGVASGIYFYSIRAIPVNGKEIFKSVKKMILLK